MRRRHAALLQGRVPALSTHPERGHDAAEHRATARPRQALTMRFLAVLLLLPAAAFAQIGFDGAPDRSPKVTIDAAVTKRSGDAIEGVINARVADGWHIN